MLPWSDAGNIDRLCNKGCGHIAVVNEGCGSIAVDGLVNEGHGHIAVSVGEYVLTAMLMVREVRGRPGDPQVTITDSPYLFNGRTACRA